MQLVQEHLIDDQSDHEETNFPIQCMKSYLYLLFILCSIRIKINFHLISLL